VLKVPAWELGSCSLLEMLAFNYFHECANQKLVLKVPSWELGSCSLLEIVSLQLFP
jgi:hypothetical protein